MADVSNEAIIAVLQEKFSNIEYRLDRSETNFNEKLARIEAQTIKTNGRVTGHDDDIEKLQHWKLVSENTHVVNKWWFLFIGAGIVSLLGWMVEIYSNAQHHP